jgi:hypothetical protein
MPAIVEFPTLGTAAVQEVGEVFATEPARRHFAEYLTGLLVAERKTVSGMNREVAVTTAHSGLHRWITAVDWDVARLNEQRVAWLQRAPSTRYAPHGVSALDHTLVSHEGQRIEEVGWLGDHAEQRSLSAHDSLIATYGCPSGKPYALEFRRCRKKEDGEAARQALAASAGGLAAADAAPQRRATCKDHPVLCKELLEGVVERELPGDFTCACSLTHAALLHYVHSQRRGYGGL